MEDRIEINGVWYVKEKPTISAKSEEGTYESNHPELHLRDKLLGGYYDWSRNGLDKLEGMGSKEYLLENDNYCLTACQLLNSDGTLLATPDYKIEVKFLDSDNPHERWFTDYIDNSSFIENLLEGVDEAWRELYDTFRCHADGVAMFYKLLVDLKEMDWKIY